jgi:hypothetical protein
MGPLREPELHDHPGHAVALNAVLDALRHEAARRGARLRGQGHRPEPDEEREDDEAAQP